VSTEKSQRVPLISYFKKLAVSSVHSRVVDSGRWLCLVDFFVNPDDLFRELDQHDL